EAARSPCRCRVGGRTDSADMARNSPAHRGCHPRSPPVSEFSSEWLDLREPADARARSAEVANAISARFALRDELHVLDLASGTGANLRATSSLLPKRQVWKLVDNDADALDTAKKRLTRWADASEF